MTQPFVGLPTDHTGCAYGGVDITGPGCEAPASIHILADSPWGVVSMSSCDAHAGVARASATTVLGEHPWRATCDTTDCWAVP